MIEQFEWYFIRATGTVAYFLLYLSVITGLYSQVRKKRKQKVNGTLYLHESLSNWALILVIGHLGFLLIDSYLKFQWNELLIPFHTTYKPFAMALGTLALYSLIVTVLTSKARKKIGYQRWRKLHALNPFLYILVTVHGLLIGTDFQGTFLAAVNLAPLVIMGIMLLGKKTNLNVSP